MASASSARTALLLLKKRYTEKIMVDLGNPEDTLLATLLSARTRDEQVLKIYPAFRKRFPSWGSLVNADVRQIAQMISTIGLYKNKAKAIHALARKILDEFQGRVPQTMEKLVTLPGVGRKTASCVLAYAFHKPAIAVDTHVFRITHRLGWAKGKNPDQVEQELAKLLPKKDWITINQTMVPFGREICQPGTPKCYLCPIAKQCAFKPKTKKS